MLALPAPSIGRGSRLLGVGAAQPELELTGDHLGRPFAKDAEWIRTRTGIRSLRRSRAAEEFASIVTAAGRNALAAAGLEEGEVDLVLEATCSVAPGPEHPTSHGAMVATHAVRITLNAACSGFCYGVQLADNLIRTGSARHVLILAAERMSGMLDPLDLSTSIIFGDGAGAAVVGPSVGRPGIGPSVMGSDGGNDHLIRWEPNGHLRMAGRDVFRWAVELVPGIAETACRRAGLELSDVDVFVPHQANLRIIDAVTRALPLRPDTVVADDVTRSGNTSAASVPIALTRLLESGRARTGQVALLVGFGAGLTYAAQVVHLP